VIPAGKYVPQFLARTAANAAAATVNGANLGGARLAAAGIRPHTLSRMSRPVNRLEERGGPVVTLPALPQPVEALPALRRRRLKTLAWIGAAGGAIVLAAAAALLIIAHRPEPEPAERESRFITSAGARFDDGIRILAGMTGDRYVDALGNTWLGDRWFVGGDAVSAPRTQLLRARDPALFVNRREGDFRYRIPLDVGIYELRLYFAERMYGAGNLSGGGETSRLFDVYANEKLLLNHLDVISDAHGSNTEDVKVFTDISPAKDGYLDLHFVGYKEKAFVNGIELLPGIPHHMRPFRIVAGPNPFKDRQGRVWERDEFAVGGQTVARSDAPSNTPEPELYLSERYGNFTYTIPVAAGTYTARLYFSEAWFGPDKPAGGGEGDRIFDVQCNGVALLKNFDVFKTAGGSNRAVVKTFRGLKPNAQGKLVFSFVPVANYAFVNAIEVVAEE
jgi:hypothetical protein